MFHNEKITMDKSENNAVLLTAEYIESLSKRLDACFGVIANDPDGAGAKIPEDAAEDVLLKHGWIYASFLSDLMAGRISASRHDLTDLLRLIQEFCEMIESESKLISKEASL